MARTGHPFWLDVFRVMAQRPHEHVMDATGPRMLTAAAAAQGSAARWQQQQYRDTRQHNHYIRQHHWQFQNQSYQQHRY